MLKDSLRTGCLEGYGILIPRLHEIQWRVAEFASDAEKVNIHLSINIDEELVREYVDSLTVVGTSDIDRLWGSAMELQVLSRLLGIRILIDGQESPINHTGEEDTPLIMLQCICGNHFNVWVADDRSDLDTEFLDVTGATLVEFEREERKLSEQSLSKVSLLDDHKLMQFYTFNMEATQAEGEVSFVDYSHLHTNKEMEEALAEQDLIYSLSTTKVSFENSSTDNVGRHSIGSGDAEDLSILEEDEVIYSFNMRPVNEEVSFVDYSHSHTNKEIEEALAEQDLIYSLSTTKVSFENSSTDNVGRHSISSGDTEDLLKYDTYRSKIVERDKKVVSLQVDIIKHQEFEMTLCELFEKGSEGILGWKLLQYLSYLDSEFVPIDIFNGWEEFSREELSIASKTLKAVSLISVVSSPSDSKVEGFNLDKSTVSKSKKYALAHEEQSISAWELITKLAARMKWVFPNVSSELDDKWVNTKLLIKSVDALEESAKCMCVFFNDIELTSLISLRDFFKKNIQNIEYGKFKVEKTVAKKKDSSSCIIAKAIIEYDNILLNDDELINKAIIYGGNKLLNLLIDIGQDSLVADDVIESVKLQGHAEVFATLLGEG